MAVSHDTRSYSQRYLKVCCSCGRRLRARVEHMGSSVRCWDCRQMVPVPVPRDPGRTAKVLTSGARDIFGASWLITIAIGAALFTGALLLPLPEPVLAALILAAVVFAYGELIRRWGSIGRLGSAQPIGPRAFAARAAATLAVALVLTNAWEFLRTWLGHELGLFQEALAVVAALAVVFPIAMLTFWAAPRPRESLLAIAQHPAATFVALMVVPVGLVAAELLILFIASVQGYLPIYLLDILPQGQELAPKFGVAAIGNFSQVYLPEPGHFAFYGYHVRHGLTLAMAIPSSLMNPTTLYDQPFYVEITRGTYLVMRALHTWIIAGAWLTALAIQARCLGLLARLWDWQRPRSIDEIANVQAELPDDSSPVEPADEETTAAEPALQPAELMATSATA
ncbi:MAG: hypothetical protein U0794_22120 [Isosphaeraceae bacterium]